MILTVVGSGTLVPQRRRSTPALALETGGFQATVDGGSGTLRRQAELGIDFRETDTLFFTHIHPDHTLDLLHFLFATAYTPGFQRRTPVRIVGPPGFERFLDHLRQGVRSWTGGGEAGLEVVELGDGDRVRMGPLEVEAVELEHPVTDVGYRFRDPAGRVLAVTGDTGWCDAACRLAREADLLVCECSTAGEEPLDGHLTARQAGRLAAEARARQLVLVHLYPLPDDTVRVGEAAEEYAGPILLAADGDRFLV